jgi:hypothetical protein
MKKEKIQNLKNLGRDFWLLQIGFFISMCGNVMEIQALTWHMIEVQKEASNLNLERY